MPPQDTISVRLEIKNQDVRKGVEDAISSVEGFHVAQRSDNPSHADILIFEIGSDLGKEFQLIHSLQNLGTVNEVFLTSRHSDPLFWSKPYEQEPKSSSLNPLKLKKSGRP